MRALATIRQLRFQLRCEMLNYPECDDLAKTEEALSFYEEMVIAKGLQNKPLGAAVQEAFAKLIIAAREQASSQIAERVEQEAPRASEANWRSRADQIIDRRVVYN